MEETSQGVARGTNRNHCRHQRNVSFANLGNTMFMWRFAMIWSLLVFHIGRNNSFMLGKDFLYFRLYFSYMIFG